LLAIIIILAILAIIAPSKNQTNSDRLSIPITIDRHSKK